MSVDYKMRVWRHIIHQEDGYDLYMEDTVNLVSNLFLIKEPSGKNTRVHFLDPVTIHMYDTDGRTQTIITKIMHQPDSRTLFQRFIEEKKGWRDSLLNAGETALMEGAV